MRGAVEVENLQVEVNYTLEGDAGVITAQTSAAFLDLLLLHSDKPAVLRPLKGEPIPIYLLRGNANLIGNAQYGQINFVVRH